MEYPKRKHPRLKNFDYGSGGTFCVTICTANRKNTLGHVSAEDPPKVKLTSLGYLVNQSILKIQAVYPSVSVYNYIVMPNHVHLLLHIQSNAPVSLLTVVRSTKAAVTRKWGSPVWQRSFYEHVARSEKEAMRFSNYIEENPLKWQLDRYYSES